MSSIYRNVLARLFCVIAVVGSLTTVVVATSLNDHDGGGSTGDPWRVTTIGRLDAVKNDILHKLRLLRPPNMTSLMPAGGGGRPVLPDIPSLRRLMESTNNDVIERQQRRLYDRGGDGGVSGDDDDDEFDRAMNVTTLAASQPGINPHNSLNG